MLVIAINTLGLYSIRFMMSASNIVEPILLTQMRFLYVFPKYLKGIMMGSPVKLTTAVTSQGIPFCIISFF